jgi:hypothetical protein
MAPRVRQDAAAELAKSAPEQAGVKGFPGVLQ